MLFWLLTHLLQAIKDWDLFRLIAFMLDYGLYKWCFKSLFNGSTFELQGSSWNQFDIRCLTFMIVCQGGQGYMIIFQLILIWHHIHFVYFICMCSLSLCRTFPLFSLYESSCSEYWYWLWICNIIKILEFVQRN